ncbi:hypothetical protein GCM10029992_42710 [Glycomyces albus]
MSALEDSINQLRAVRESIDGGRNRLASAHDELERHQGSINQASETIEGATTWTSSAADGLEMIANATRGLNFDSKAESVENAKERVANAADHLRAAGEHVAKAAVEINSVRQALGETSGTLAESDTAVEEALNRLSSLTLSGGGSSGDGSKAASFLSRLQFKLPRNHSKLRSPHPRHRFQQVAKSKYVDNSNTVALPHVDISADAEAIRSGKALWEKENNRFHVNGRQYVAKDKDGKTRLYPVEGDGLVPLTSGEYKALQGTMIAGGDRANRPEHLVNNPSISDGDWDRATVFFDLVTRDGQGERP